LQHAAELDFDLAALARDPHANRLR
jgi:hypothetical protein